MSKQSKICIDPVCEVVWLDVPAKECTCKDCGEPLTEITTKQYLKKFLGYKDQFFYNSNQRFNYSKEFMQLKEQLELYLKERFQPNLKVA